MVVQQKILLNKQLAKLLITSPCESWMRTITIMIEEYIFNLIYTNKQNAEGD